MAHSMKIQIRAGKAAKAFSLRVLAPCFDPSGQELQHRGQNAGLNQDVEVSNSAKCCLFFDFYFHPSFILMLRVLTQVPYEDASLLLNRTDRAKTSRNFRSVTLKCKISGGIEILRQMQKVGYCCAQRHDLMTEIQGRTPNYKPIYFSLTQK